MQRDNGQEEAFGLEFRPLEEGTVAYSAVIVIEIMYEDGSRGLAVRYGGDATTWTCIGMMETMTAMMKADAVRTWEEESDDDNSPD